MNRESGRKGDDVRGGSRESQGFEGLLEVARQAAGKAYAPYSGFRVGAALRGRSGRIYLGCNVENAVYNLGICAERAALFAAVAAGEREFDAIAVVAADRDDPCPPCGACRQVLAEFSPDLKVVLAAGRLGGEGGIEVYSVAELLPHGFSLTPSKDPHLRKG